MAPSDRTAGVMRSLITSVPGIGRVQLMKLLYLADLEARRHLDRPLTELNYIWYTHGPFDSAVYVRLDALKDAGEVEETAVPLANGSIGYRYRADPKIPPAALAVPEQAILGYVVNGYGGAAVRGELDEIIDRTAPMRLALKQEAFAHRLHMELVDGEARRAGDDIETILAAAAELDAGGGKRLDDIRVAHG